MIYKDVSNISRVCILYIHYPRVKSMLWPPHIHQARPSRFEQLTSGLKKLIGPIFKKFDMVLTRFQVENKLEKAYFFKNFSWWLILVSKWTLECFFYSLQGSHDLCKRKKQLGGPTSHPRCSQLTNKYKLLIKKVCIKSIRSIRKYFTWETQIVFIDVEAALESSHLNIWTLQIFFLRESATKPLKCFDINKYITDLKVVISSISLSFYWKYSSYSSKSLMAVFAYIWITRS